MDAPSSAITEVAGRKKAPRKSSAAKAPVSAKTPAKKTFANTTPPAKAAKPTPAPAPVADATGRGRRAVMLKDGRVKADVLKSLKADIAASKTDLSNKAKTYNALDKQVNKYQAGVDAGKASSAALKTLKPQIKAANSAFKTHDKAHSKLLAQHDKIKAYQPK